MTSVAPEVIQNTPKSAPKKTKPKSEKKEKLEIVVFIRECSCLCNKSSSAVF